VTFVNAANSFFFASQGSYLFNIDLLISDLAFISLSALLNSITTLLTALNTPFYNSLVSPSLFSDSLVFASFDPNNTNEWPKDKPDYLAVVRLAETIELPEDFFSKMTYLERERARDIEKALRIGATTDDEFIESKMFFRMQKAYQMLEKPKTETEKFLDYIAAKEMELIEPMDYYTLNYTNKINIKGEVVDVSKWDRIDVLKFLKSLDANEANRLYNTEHVYSLFHVSTPNMKLYYPEPYIAAPSRIHTDIWFLHILHYQFWLWFFFIFLIVLFFLVFIITVRWNQNTNRPRRETRGVSRSKCGDLVTACVPVSWAASIIISESADVVDITDGFSTAELVVGVRAYQWGWEYYYPKSIDLNYNVRPSYASFIGNSVKYSTTSNTTNESNHFWRHYQKKNFESIVTPAHMLMLPFDNANVANFLNFNDIGANTLKQSSAFAKIRANSKLFNTNIVTNADHFALKYAKINELAFGSGSEVESSNYGSIRQHNLTAAKATLNNLATCLNEKEMLEFLTSSVSESNKKVGNLLEVNSSFDSENFFTSQKNINALGKYLNYVYLMNDSTDVKKIKHTFNMLGSTKQNSVINVSSTQLLLNNSMLPTSVLESFTSNNTLNKSFSSMKTLLKGANSNILTPDQLIRNYPDLKNGFADYNLSNKNNPIHSLIVNSSSQSSFKNSLIPVTSNISLVPDSQTFAKLWSRRNSFGYPHPIIYSNNPLANIIEYDTNNQTSLKIRLKKNLVKSTQSVSPTETNLAVFGEQTNALPSLQAAYWRMFWSGTDVLNRVGSNSKTQLSEVSFYLPVFTTYYDYDFRNAQAMELLEDAFWESSNSSYTFYDYINLSKDFVKSQNVSNGEVIFNGNFFADNTNLSNTNKLLLNPVYKDVSLIGQLYSNSLESDDFTSTSDLMLLKNFSIFPNIDLFSNFDEFVTSYKNLQTLTNSSLGAVATTPNWFNTPSSYLSVFNMFRSDFEDFNLISSEDVVNDFANNNSYEISNLKNTQLSNLLVLRSNVKNSVVTFNALRKVFRSRFDEGRSHTSLQLFAQSNLPQPFINDKSVSYNQLLSKDTNSYYQNVFYKNNPFKIWNTNFLNSMSQNYSFYDLPFLLSEGSDSQKYMWFDWWAQWGVYEVQPSSVAKYSTLGVPYSRKHFDFGAGQGDVLQDVETYFTRVARLRRNYLSNWLYTPYLFNRLNTLNVSAFPTDNSLTSLRSLLLNMHWLHKTITYKDSSVFRFSPSISGINLYNKTAWRPFTGIQAYFSKNAQIMDILTRREYLYRQYLQTNKRVISLPALLTNNLNNELISEIKTSFLLTDPITYNSAVSRDFFYTSLPFFKFLVFKSIIADLVSKNQLLPFNTDLVNEYLFFYALNTDSTKINNNSLLYKDQHRPLKKGITSMLRLHGTGAIAMPVDVRLQILASSRDVIHSWAIPSAGIKIDCVPGYTSHRIMTFTLTGIYWGQCMEICGRYHHWMPIIVYFIKRDLFFLWCTHFVFKSSKLPNWKLTDKQYTNYIRLISYDKSTWLSELSRQM
jgi:heme/copper-type cytochrome/quinol oxidase subunit 2